MNSEHTVREALTNLKRGGPASEVFWFGDPKHREIPPRVTPVVYRGTLEVDQAAATFRLEARNVEVSYEGVSPDTSSYDISVYVRRYEVLSAVEKDLIPLLLGLPETQDLDGPTDSWDEDNEWYVRSYSIEVEEGPDATL